MAAELVLSTQEAHHCGFAMSYSEFLSRSLDVMPPIIFLSKVIDLTGAHASIIMHESWA
jgi:hypothetical protein